MMIFKVVELDILTDRLRGVKLGMLGCVNTIVSTYLGHKLYAVTFENGKETMLYDWQIEVV